MRIPKGAIFIFFMLHFYAWVDVCYKFSFLVHSIYFCSSWFKRSFINQRLALFTFLPSSKKKRNFNSLSAVKLTKVRCVPVRQTKLLWTCRSVKLKSVGENMAKPWNTHTILVGWRRVNFYILIPCPCKTHGIILTE